MENLTPLNTDKFPVILAEHIKNLILSDIKLLLITRKDENSYLDLDKYYAQFKSNNGIVSKVVTEIQEYLQNVLQWKTALGFGNTGLFIYSTEELPKSCW